MMKLTDANRPLRVLEKALEGGLGVGNLGVVMARHGSGKVAVLTSITIDHAMDKRQVLHVAVGESVSDLRAYDDTVLHQMCESLDVQDEAALLTRVERHKQIYSFRDPAGFSADRLRQTLEFLREHAEFRPSMIEIHGWPDFSAVSPEETAAVKKIAGEFECEVWLTAHTSREDLAAGVDAIPVALQPHAEHFSVMLALEPESKHLEIRFVKVHDSKTPPTIPLQFDPKKMLIRWR